MSNRVVCQNCGAKVDLPPGYARAKIRCPGCGYYAEVPTELRGAGEEPASPPSPPTARRPAGPPPEPPPPPPAHSRPVARDEDKPDLDPLGFAEPPPPPPPVKPKPAPRPAVRAKPQANPRDHRAEFEPTPGASVPPLLEGNQDEEDAGPYAVPGEGLKRCPDCRGQLPLDADFCVHCGTEMGTGARAKRTFQPIDATWHEGWAPMLRLQVFVVLQVINLVAAVLLMATSSSSFTDFGGICTLTMTNLFQIALQALIVGSYDTLNVKRTAKGAATVTRTRRVAFIKFAPTRLNWKQSTNVGIVGTDVGCLANLFCLYFVVNAFTYTMIGVFLSPFMLGLALIYFATAAGFYWFVIRPQRFEVNLCDVYGSTDEKVHRCDDRQQAEDVAYTLADATGLFYKPVQ